MFIDEVKDKLKIDTEVLPYTLTLLGKRCAIVCGVKNVVLSSKECIRIRLSGCIAEIIGQELQIVQMGGGDLYVKGGISSVRFD